MGYITYITHFVLSWNSGASGRFIDTSEKFGKKSLRAFHSQSSYKIIMTHLSGQSIPLINDGHYELHYSNQRITICKTRLYITT